MPSAHDAFPDPWWINEHEYETMWQGNVVRVDIRRQRPIMVSEELMRESELDIKRTLRSRKYIYYKTGRRELRGNR